MKWMRWMGALALVVTCSLSGMACKKDAAKSVRTLSKALQSTLGIKPNFVLAFNLKAIRTSPPAQEMMKKYRAKITSFFQKEKMKACNGAKLMDSLNSAVVLGFDNMNWNYAAVNGDFDAPKLVACLEKSAKGKAKSKTLHGTKVYMAKDNYFWVTKHGIVGLAPSPRRARLKKTPKWKAAGKGGLLEKLLTDKGILGRGLLPKLSSKALTFRVEGLGDAKLPMALPMKLPMPSALWGSLNVTEDLDVKVNVEFKDAEVAKSMKTTVAAASVFLPDDLSNALKAKNDGKILRLHFKHNMKKLVAMAQKAAKKFQKRLIKKSRFGKSRGRWKVRMAPSPRAGNTPTPRTSKDAPAPRP